MIIFVLSVWHPRVKDLLLLAKHYEENTVFVKKEDN